ncbi:MAG: hypothetical protein WCI36_04825 [bacterium]
MEQDKKRAELEQRKVFQQELEFQKEELEKEEVFEKEEEIEKTEVENEEENVPEKYEIIEKKKRREAIFELVLFFILGVLLGVTLKTEAVKRITIGFNDYQITKPAESYDVVALKKKLEDELTKQQDAAQQNQQASPAATNNQK